MRDRSSPRSRRIRQPSAGRSTGLRAGERGRLLRARRARASDRRARRSLPRRRASRAPARSRATSRRDPVPPSPAAAWRDGTSSLLVRSPRRRRARSQPPSRPWYRRRDRRVRRSRKHAELVERVVKIGRVAVHAERAGTRELIFAVAAAEESNAEHAGTPRREEIPDSVPDDIALAHIDTQPLRTGHEQIRLGFRTHDVAALDDDSFGGHAERSQGAVDLRSPSRRRDPVRDLALAELAQQLDGPRQRPPLRQQLTEELTVPLLHPLRLVRPERPTYLARDRTREQPAAHADPPMNAPGVDGKRVQQRH